MTETARAEDGNETTLATEHPDTVVDPMAAAHHGLWPLTGYNAAQHAVACLVRQVRIRSIPPEQGHSPVTKPITSAWTWVHSLPGYARCPGSVTYRALHSSCVVARCAP